MLGVPEIAGTQEIEIERINPFPNHPFKLLDDDKMETLVDSVRENGILNPVIVRPDQTGNYKMISGHRRLHAAGIVGLAKIPAIVKEMTEEPNLANATQYNIISNLNGALPQKTASAKVALSEKKLDKYFPSYYSAKQREDIIIQLLEQWSQAQEQ